MQCLQRARAEHERSAVETQALNDILRATDRLHLLDGVVDRTGDVVDADSRNSPRMKIRAGNSPWLRYDARAQRDLGGGVRSSEHLFVRTRVLIDAVGVVKCRRAVPCGDN